MFDKYHITVSDVIQNINNLIFKNVKVKMRVCTIYFVRVYAIVANNILKLLTQLRYFTKW